MKKICSQCGENKEETEFNWKDKDNNKRTAYCRICHSIKMKIQYNKNKEQYIIKAARNNAKISQFIWDYLKTHACVDCGETDPIVLEFDHRNPNEKEFEVSKGHGVSRKRLVVEIEKCEIRCANCHKRKTAKQFGWYKNITK